MRRRGRSCASTLNTRLRPYRNRVQAASARLVRGALTLLGLLAALDGRAIVFLATDDPAHNTSAPTGAWAGSGWEFQGYWQAMLGTVIASNLFLTANHGGGTVGDPFHYRGVAYPTLAVFRDPGSDLAIWKVCGTFAAAAPLFSRTNETGRDFVVFGRGLTRGEPVRYTNGTAVVERGWRWSATGSGLAWGVNRVSGRVSVPQATPGELLEATFDADGGSEECALAGGDSGGAWFLLEDGQWQLAGITFAVDGPYNYTDSGAGFHASLLDARGFFVGGEGQWQTVRPSPRPQPSASYATRLAPRLAWVQGVIDTESASAEPVGLETADTVAGAYAVADAAIDPAARTVTLPLPTGNRFYRLRSCRAVRVTGVAVAEGTLRLSYE